jgi:glycolate oxidase iron-sulfur subunit
MSIDLPTPTDVNKYEAGSFLDSEKALACIHCGLCLSSCPTYLETGNENDSPRGRIHIMKALHEGRLALEDSPVRHLDLCLGCRACEAACPSGVQYGALLEASREFVERTHSRSLWQRFLRRVLIEKILPYPERMEIAVAPALAAKRSGLARWLPGFARKALSLLPTHATRDVSAEWTPAAGQPSRGQVGFIRGCVMSVLFGDTNHASVRLLTRAGYDVVAPLTQGCCGALYAHGGNLEAARAAARRNISAFEAYNLSAIVINAAGCGSTLKEYGHLLHNDPVWAERAAQFSGKVKDLTQWLMENGGADASGRPRQEFPRKITTHDACHLAHAQRITQAPRALVKAVAGHQLVEMPEADVCCGSAGSYNLLEPAMAERLQQRKVENILRSGAQIVVSTNPGCLMQIRAGLDRAGAHHIETLHIADFLDRYQAPDPATPIP